MVIFIDEIGQIIDGARKAHERGDIQAMMVITIGPDGVLQTSFSENLSYLERIGLLEVAKQAVHIDSLAVE